MTHKNNTYFYKYRQNNSWGQFYSDVLFYFIEAKDVNEANKRAEEETEIYFNGCNLGIDCPCCGDRWRTKDEFSNLYEYEVFDNKEKILDKLSERTLMLKSNKHMSMVILHQDGFAEKITLKDLMNQNNESEQNETSSD